MKRMIVFLALIAIFCSGCAFQRASDAARAKTELIGMTKIELLSCAGVPIRQEKVGNLEFLTYSGGGDSGGPAFGTAVSPSTVIGGSVRFRRYCEATFILNSGVVEKIIYAGRTGPPGASGEQCAFIIENCLK